MLMVEREASEKGTGYQYLLSNYKNRYAMGTRVCYLEIEQSHGKKGKACFANKGHLRFVSVAFGSHCGR